MNLRKRLVSLLLAIVIFTLTVMPVSASEVSGSDSAVSSSDTSETITPSYSAAADMRDITATELVDEINLGWNLGEALESWSSDAGYDDYYNSNAYQLILRYDDSENIRSTSVAKQFDENNTCTISWATGLIDSDSETAIGQIGFEIWNLAVEAPTEVTINVTKAKLTRRNNVVIELDELLGEHTLTISKYGTVALMTDDWPSNISRTYGITDGTYEVTVELVDFPQMEYGKAEYFETLWNNPLTTYEMITEIKRAGFNAVRIPVTFFNHIPSSSDVIDAEWIDRIQEVVDYVIQQDMYCILCLYHDGSTTGWLRVASDTDVDKYSSIWTQLSERFRDYDERLLFQGYNELTDKDNTWEYPGKTDIEWVNELAQTFVDTVRATGGNNSKRCLIVSPYAGSHEQEIIDSFELPSDSAYDRLIVAVNAYFPALFSYDIELGTEEDSDGQAVSSTDTSTWGTEQEKADMDALFAKLYRRFTSKGIPVMITEFCSADKDNTEARVAHAAYYTEKSAEYGIPCFWWDDGNLFLRRTMVWSYEEIVNAMVDSTSMHLRYLTVEFPENIYYTGEPVYPEPRVYYYGGDVLSGTDLVSGSDVVLTEGVDYDLMYFNNTELGKASVLLTCKGDYSGFAEYDFMITEEPAPVSVLTNLAKSDPDLPLVIMLSIPVILIVTAIGIYKMMRRREREQIAANISGSLEGINYADVSDLDESASDFSYLHIKPHAEPKQKSRSKKTAELADMFEEHDIPTAADRPNSSAPSSPRRRADISSLTDQDF